MLDRPVAWVSQVERGLGQADPMSVLEAVASALGTPLPAQCASSRACAASTPAIRALRHVVCREHLSRGADSGFPSPAVGFLRTQADKAWSLTGARRYGDLAELLAALLPDLDAALLAAPAEQRAGVYELIATSYQACSAALAKLGQHDSAKTAASRALTAGQRAGNLMLAAASAYLLVCIHMETGRFNYAEETAQQAAAALARPAADGRPEAIALRGALTLQRALIAARTSDPAAAQDQLSRAKDMADRLCRAGGGAGDGGFGPDHVALYEIAVSIETGGAGRAAPLRSAAVT